METRCWSTLRAPDEPCQAPMDPQLLELLPLEAKPVRQTSVPWMECLDGWLNSFIRFASYLGLLAPNPTARKEAPILAPSPQARTITPQAMVTGSRDVTSIQEITSLTLNVLLKYVVYLSSNETKKKGLEENPKRGESFGDRIGVSPSYILVVLIEAVGQFFVPCNVQKNCHQNTLNLVCARPCLL